MRSFIDLVGFEYKKIFKRKGAVLTLIIVTVLTVVSPAFMLIGHTYIDGEPFETKYQAMVKDRNYARTLSGRYIDETLLSETAEAYSKIPPVGSNESYVGIPEYQEYGRPYSEIYNIAYTVYGSDFRLMQDLTREQMQNFYQIRHNEMSSRINEMDISDKSKNKLIHLDREIKTPFLFSYADTYDRFFGIMYTTGVFVAFAIAVCLAPMFAGEYVTRADQLILSSKFGKNKIIGAKLFAGISFCTGFCLILTILTYLVCAGIYGFDGGNAPVQLWFSFCVYPLTMWQSAVIFSVCIYFAAILICAVTLFLSSVFKSPFGVMIIISLFIFVPMMFNTPSNLLLFNLFRLLPSNMMAIWAVLIDYTPYELFGLSVTPYVFMPLFAAISASILLPFAYRAFKNHPIG